MGARRGRPGLPLPWVASEQMAREGAHVQTGRGSGTGSGQSSGTTSALTRQCPHPKDRRGHWRGTASTNLKEQPGGRLKASAERCDLECVERRRRPRPPEVVGSVRPVRFSSREAADAARLFPLRLVSSICAATSTASEAWALTAGVAAPCARNVLLGVISERVEHSAGPDHGCRPTGRPDRSDIRIDERTACRVSSMLLPARRSDRRIFVAVERYRARRRRSSGGSATADVVSVSTSSWDDCTASSRRPLGCGDRTPGRSWDNEAFPAQMAADMDDDRDEDDRRRDVSRHLIILLAMTASTAPPSTPSSA